MKNDSTRQVLGEYVLDTQDILLEALLLHDKSASCRLVSSLDIGFPHDVDRIAGGFPTGMYVTWASSLPFVPVDTTVNVCTSSMYVLSNIICYQFTEDVVKSALNKLQESCYSVNLHRGNHFVVLAANNSMDKNYLFIHSSAAEFKRQFNGLYPVKGNWYMESVQIHYSKGRYIRYLIGKKAELFVKIARHLKTYNELRHDFFADVILEGLSSIVSARHYHHYYMPTDQSILIGSFLVQGGEVVPIFSRPGKPITLFKVNSSGTNRFEIDETEHFLVPHGWGKCSNRYPRIRVDIESNTFELNDFKFKIDGHSSLRDHPDLMLRDYIYTPGLGYQDFESELLGFCSGTITEHIFQLASFNKQGFVRWSQY